MLKRKSGWINDQELLEGLSNKHLLNNYINNVVGSFNAAVKMGHFDRHAIQCKHILETRGISVEKVRAEIEKLNENILQEHLLNIHEEDWPQEEKLINSNLKSNDRINIIEPK